MAAVWTQVRYAPDIAREILSRFASGETMVSICKRKGMPTREAVRLWVEEDREGFLAPHTRAKRLHAEARALKSGEILYELDDERLVELGRVAGTAVKLREMRSNYEMAMASFLDREAWGAHVDITGAITVGHLDVGTLLSLQANAARASLPIQASAEVEAERAPEQLTDVVDAGTSEGAAGTREPDPNDVLEE